MKTDNYIVKTASRQDLDIAIDWALKEGWNPGLYDADCYYSADANGFLIGWLGDEAIATISAVKYNNRFGFLGFYIVKPEYRGKGYGRQIWNAGMDTLINCNIGLDGVVEQQEKYIKYGFSQAYRNIRYQSFGGGQYPKDAQIIKLASVPFESLERYERPFFPEQRSVFLNNWINQPESIALAIQQDQQLLGYGVMRRCFSGYKIGPLFADTPSLAESLFLALKSHANDSEPVYLDIPESNPEALALVKRFNMTVVFETARMYKGAAPEMPINKIYGITSFEIG